MNDFQRVQKALENRTKPCVLATVVATEGSTYRRAGARMVVFEDLSSVGAISGGCLESDVIENAQTVMQSGSPMLLRYDSRSDDDPILGMGMGCNGVTTVFLERLSGNDDPFFVFLKKRFSLRDKGVIATVFSLSENAGKADKILLEGYRAFYWQIAESNRQEEESDDNFGESDFAEEMREFLWAKASTILTSEKPVKPLKITFERQSVKAEVLLEEVPLPRELVIWGAGYDTLPLAEYASAQGWRVIVADHRPLYLTKERFPKAAELRRTTRENTAETAKNLDFSSNTAVVIMSHNLAIDAAVLYEALRSEAGYIGLLGPKQRLKKIVNFLSEQGQTLGEADLKRLYSPIGLDIGAETAEEVALAIVAEIQAVMNTRSGGFLRKRKKAKIHS